MNTTTAYTPLESLLLFQSLTVWGTDPDVFIRTSSLLKTNTLIRDGDTYDPGRLSPDALRELYLQLLREELRLEATQGEGKGDASPTRKRKLQSPPLPTIKDANEYSEKLPQLVDRLYGRYRDFMIRSIREDERKYETLQREIAEIERGEWDERILKDDRIPSKRTPSVAPEESKPTEATDESSETVTEALQDGQPIEASSDSKQTDGQQLPMEPSPSPIPPTGEEPKSEGLPISDVLNNRDRSPPKGTELSTVLQAENPPTILPPIGHQRTPSQGKLPGPPPVQPVQHPTSENWRTLPQQHSPYLANASYPQFSQPHYPHGPHRGSFSAPPGHGLPLPQGHLPTPSINNSHPPLILPPPNIGRGPGSPGTQHLSQLADAAEQQYRATSASPLMQQGGVPAPQYGQSYAAYPQPYLPDGRPLTGNDVPPQWNPNYAPPYPPPPPNYNYPLPPPGHQSFSATPNIIQPGPRQYNSPYIPNQGNRPVVASSTATPRPPHLRGLDSLPHTPTSFGRAPNMTGKATRWTPTPTASTPKVPKSPIQPAYEPLSPVLPTAILPPLKNAKTPKGSARAKKDTKADSSSTSQPRGKRQSANKRTKTGSPASSAIAGSLRSQSVMSHADELSLINDAASGVNVKQEAVTPRVVDDIGEMTAEENNRSVHSETLPASPRRPLKRKRQESLPREPSGPPTHVLWTRNFPKISASALERIGAHRSASTFALPIKERDAPGYSNVILRPQDLKSIRVAINAGYKAGLAIASTMGDHGQASMLLPISEDLVPPKGIVNNAQLEKELMHVFSNAIMFNHDPRRGLGRAFEAAQSIEESTTAENYQVDENQLVNDTRAMFTDVEKIVGEMRSAERRQKGVAGGEAEEEEEEADELAGEAEVASGNIVKRRRRA